MQFYPSLSFLMLIMPQVIHVTVILYPVESIIKSSLLLILFNSGLIFLILLNISLYDTDFILAIIAKDLSMPSSDLKDTLNMDLNLAKYIINASSTLYGWPIFLSPVGTKPVSFYTPIYFIIDLWCHKTNCPYI